MLIDPIEAVIAFKVIFWLTRGSLSALKGLFSPIRCFSRRVYIIASFRGARGASFIKAFKARFINPAFSRL